MKKKQLMAGVMAAGMAMSLRLRRLHQHRCFRYGKHRCLYQRCFRCRGRRHPALCMVGRR